MKHVIPENQVEQEIVLLVVPNQPKEPMFRLVQFFSTSAVTRCLMTVDASSVIGLLSVSNSLDTPSSDYISFIVMLSLDRGSLLGVDRFWRDGYSGRQNTRNL